MELSLESLSSFRPKTGSMDEWNAAYVRVEDYLRAHRMHNRLHQSRIIQKVLERAAARHERSPYLDPTTLAAEEIDRMMGEWFGELLGEKHLPPERITSAGRVALLLAEGPEKWPYAFLDDQNIPADFSESVQKSSLQAGPDLAVSSMVPRPIDLGPITSAAGETLERLDRWPVVRTLFLWTVFTLALGAIFYATR